MQFCKYKKCGIINNLKTRLFQKQFEILNLMHLKGVPKRPLANLKKLREVKPY